MNCSGRCKSHAKNTDCLKLGIVPDLKQFAKCLEVNEKTLKTGIQEVEFALIGRQYFGGTAN